MQNIKWVISKEKLQLYFFFRNIFNKILLSVYYRSQTYTYFTIKLNKHQDTIKLSLRFLGYLVLMAVHNLFFWIFSIRS